MQREGCQLQNLVHDAERKIVAITPKHKHRSKVSPEGDTLDSRDQLNKMRKAHEDLDDAELARLQAEAVEGLGDAERKIVAITPKLAPWGKK